MKAFIHAFCPSKLNSLFVNDNQVFLQKHESTQLSNLIVEKSLLLSLI